MAEKISLLLNNNLPTFIEIFIGDAVEDLNKLDVGRNENWLDFIPYGDLAFHMVGQIENVKDDQRVLRYGIGFACTAAFGQALVRNCVTSKVDPADYESFISELWTFLDKATTEIGSFDVRRFWESKLVIEFVDLLERILVQAGVSDNHRVRILNYIRDYSRSLFYRLLQIQSALFAKLSTLLDSKLYALMKQQFQLEEYRAKLKNQYTEVMLNDQRGMTLDAIYQEPGFKIFEKCLKKGDYHKDRYAFVSASELDIGDNVHHFVNDWLAGKERSEVLDLQQSRLLLLFGYPGQGKTSFCKRLAYDLLDKKPIDGQVYMIELRNLGSPGDLTGEVLLAIKKHLKVVYNLEIENLGKSLLVLDGLDELFMSHKLKSSDVDEIIKNVNSELPLNPQLKIIITSRFGHLNLEKIPRSGILICQLEELDLEAQKDWLRKYRNFYPECWLTEDDLTNIAQDKRSYLRELVTQPILLFLVATLDEGVSDNVNRAKVYESLFNQITHPKAWKKYQIAPLDGLEAEDLRAALQEMAYEIWRSDQEYIHKSSVEKLDSMKRIEKNLTHSNHIKHVLKVMMVAFYFQEVTKEQDNIEKDPHHYAIEFLHKSLQEYLTAEHIWNKILDEFLKQETEGERAYLINNGAVALKVLQEIFGSQAMNSEIQDYLLGVIENDSEEKKGELARRLDYFFDYFLRKDFLQYFDGNEADYPFRIGTRVFHGTWAVYSYLRSEENHRMESEWRSLFVAILRSRGGGHRINLRGIDLSNVNLRGADLQGAKFNNVNLNKADLRGASLSDADFRGANFNGANLRGANLNGANFNGANLRGANLNGANLQGAKFREAGLSVADFSGTDLSAADFYGADLLAADLSAANLSEANLGAANLRIADLRGANLRKTDLRMADLHGADLRAIRNVIPQQFLTVKHVEQTKGLSSVFLSEILSLRVKIKSKTSGQEE